MRQELIEDLQLMLPVSILLGGVLAIVFSSAVESDRRRAQYEAQAAQWRQECRAEGGFVRHERIETKKLFKKKKVRYRTICVKASVSIK